MCSLTILETALLDQGVRRLQERIFLHLLHLLVTPGVPSLVAVLLQALPLSSCVPSVSMWSPLLFLLSTLVIGFRANQTIQDKLISKSLTLHLSAKTISPHKGIFIGSETWVYLLGATAEPTTIAMFF